MNFTNPTASKSLPLTTGNAISPLSPRAVHILSYKANDRHEGVCLLDRAFMNDGSFGILGVYQSHEDAQCMGEVWAEEKLQDQLDTSDLPLESEEERADALEDWPSRDLQEDGIWMRQLDGCYGNETLIVKAERYEVVDSSPVQDLVEDGERGQKEVEEG